MAAKASTPGSGLAAKRKVSNIECLSVETQHQNGSKQMMYSLAVQWSDGSKTPAEVSHSSLAEFRLRLKNECYGTQPEVNVPEIPALSSSRLDIGQVVVKRDDKKKKAIQEFLQEIVKLPDTPKKTRLLREFFNSQDDQTSQDANSSRVVYAEVIRRPAEPTTNNVKRDQNHSVNDVIVYADLEVPEHRLNGLSSARGKSSTANGVGSSRDSEVLYADVVPRMALATLLAHADDEVTSPVDEVDGKTLNDEQSGRLYVNVPPSPSSRPYENVAFAKKGTPQVVGKQYYRVVSKYVPNTSHIQGLPVETGDIVQAQQEETSGRRIHCILCARSSVASISGRQIEGWIPVEFLEACQPEVKEGTESSVPIILSDDPRVKPPAAAPRAKAINTTPLSKQSSPRLKLKMKKPSVQEKEELSQLSDFYMLDAQSTLLPTSTVPKVPDIPTPFIASQPSKAMLEILAARAMDQQQKSTCTDVVKAIAIADYSSPPGSGIMSFQRGNVGHLAYTTPNNWWLVRVGDDHGWVPGDYWQILAEDGRIGSGDTAPWMVGALSRVECEQLLMKHGQQRNYVIRQSTNLTGQFALSIKYNGKLHHFPIIPTEDGKFYIGKHHFSSINNVVIYYTKHTLFVDEAGNNVTLGSPLKAV